MEILGYALFAVWFTKWFSPIQPIKDAFIEAYTRYCIEKELFGLQKLAIILSCPRCFGFWFTLLYTYNFWLALIVSALAFVITFIIDKIEDYYGQY